MAASAIEGASATALRSVLNRVHQAAERCGRPADQVRVVAVSKTKPISVIKQVYDAGHRCFGENYVWEIVEKAPQLPADIKWHFIGHLQSNKVKTLLGNSQPSWNLHSSRFSIGVPSRKLNNSFSAFKEFCTFESQSQSQSSESKIPPELLKKQTSLKPDRTVGQHQDLVTNITNFENEDKGLIVLAGDVFDVPIRKDIIHRVVRWQLAKRQQGTHSTKRISEVSGTGKKPYNQKGTGRARHGTLRGPQFRGGAIVHGPKPRSHAFKLNKKVRRLGLKIALSARAAEGKLLVFENLELPNHKTKNIVNYVSQMENTKKVLLVDGEPINDNLYLATGNLHYVNVLPSIGLNVYSILQHDTLVMTRDAIDKIVTRMHTPINR